MNDALLNIQNLLSEADNINRQFRKKADESGEHFNIFKVLRLTSSEVKLHSAFIAELLNPSGSHKKGNLFLLKFIQMLENLKNNPLSDMSFKPADATDATVERWLGYVSESEGGYIDILLTDKHHNHIIIENKIYAGDQRNQLKRYHSYDSASPIIYLTLDGRPPSIESTGGDPVLIKRIISISYRDQILIWLEDCIKEAENNPRLRETLTQYIHLVKHLTHQTMENDEKNALITTILANPDHVNALTNLSNNKIFDEIRYKILNDLGNKLLTGNVRFTDSGIGVYTYLDSSNTGIKCPFGKGGSAVWFHKKDWKYCIYFSFEEAFETITYGIDVVSFDMNERDPSAKLMFRECLKTIANPISAEDWMWKANLDEYQRMSWPEVIDDAEELILKKVDLIIKLAGNLL